MGPPHVNWDRGLMVQQSTGCQRAFVPRIFSPRDHPLVEKLPEAY